MPTMSLPLNAVRGPAGARTRLAASTERDARRTLTVAASATLLVLAVFSAAVTTVAQSSHDLHAGVAGETWTLSGMSLGLAIALLTVGTLADDHGRRRVLAWSTALLAGGSAVGALAPDIQVLVASRVLQGVAGAGAIAASLGLIGHAFPGGAPRTRATAVWGAAVGAGIATGPLVAAGLTAASGWRVSFWFEALVAAALLPAVRGLPESRSDRPRPLDLPGAVTLAAAMACLTAGLVEGRSNWSSPTTIALLAAGVALLAQFALLELRREHPMLELRLLAQPLFVASLAGALFTGLAVIGLMSFSPTFMERALHLSVVSSAAILASWSATSMVVALAARRLPDRVSAQARLAIGLTVTAGGELLLSRMGTGSSWTQLIPGLVLAGVGSGLANAALGRLAVESVPHHRVGMGSGANNTARYLGGAAGVAIVVAVASAGGGATGAHALLSGWDHAALLSSALCILGAVIAAAARVSRKTS
jgi:MFS family permease